VNRRNSIIWGLTASTALALSNPSWAMAAGNFETCVGSSGNTYACVTSTGYKGTDPYNVSRFSVRAADGSLHSCTSYAAYRLYFGNPYMPSISNFDSAQYWASQAVARVGATLSITPRVGDIAWWDATGVPAVGHVAVVDAISYTPSGGILSIKVSDDNAGRLVTTNKTLFPGVTSGTMIYPQKFIRFPSYPANGGGGSRPPVATNEPLASMEGTN
jgi:surface antigen